MRLVEAIVAANHRALEGDTSAGINPEQFAESLPIAALTCIDARLNHLLPNVLGIAEQHFIWLRNAGNVITGPLSSTTRSMSLACAIKGAKEIIIIGHSDCLVRKTGAMDLTARLEKLGISRNKLPSDLQEYFGLFASERANVIKGTGFLRMSPLIGNKVPVHGMVVDIETGKLEWLVNGYQTLGQQFTDFANDLKTHAGDALRSIDTDKLGMGTGEWKFPNFQIGDYLADTLHLPGTQVSHHPHVNAPLAEPTSPPMAPPILASAQPIAGSNPAMADIGTSEYLPEGQAPSGLPKDLPPTLAAFIKKAIPGLKIAADETSPKGHKQKDPTNWRK